jgi:hypothetical protein
MYIPVSDKGGRDEEDVELGDDDEDGRPLELEVIDQDAGDGRAHACAERKRRRPGTNLIIFAQNKKSF